MIRKVENHQHWASFQVFRIQTGFVFSFKAITKEKNNKPKLPLTNFGRNQVQMGIAKTISGKKSKECHINYGKEIKGKSFNGSN